MQAFGVPIKGLEGKWGTSKALGFTDVGRVIEFPTPNGPIYAEVVAVQRLNGQISFVEVPASTVPASYLTSSELEKLKKEEGYPKSLEVLKAVRVSRT